MSALSDRIRGIVRPAANPPTQTADDSRNPKRAAASLAPLKGEWSGGCFVVERRWTPEARHGREAIGTYAGYLDDASAAAPLFAAGASARPPFVFFDLETTGLSGGAGTLAFLVGCGSFTAEGGFAVRQFLLATPADEQALLAQVHGALTAAGTIVSFNGKSFDAPLLESRFAYHRLARTIAEQPHLDALHPVRQFWPAHDCSLGSIERRLLGVRRVGDVDGFEMPARYFQFLRSGDARPLAAVFEHNAHDLLTLGALTARLLGLAHIGPEAARDAREAIALGRIYARAADDRRSREAFTCAVDLAGTTDDPEATVDALRGLAMVLRRARDYHAAAACWRRLVDMDACPPAIVREAAEALAIHHEHRVRDFAAAKTFALRSLEMQRTPRWAEGVRYRVARIDRKLGNAGSTTGRLL